MAFERKIANVSLSISALNAKIERLTHRRDELQVQLATLETRKLATEVVAPRVSRNLRAVTNPSPTGFGSADVAKPAVESEQTSVKARTLLDMLARPGTTGQEARQCLTLLSAYTSVDASVEAEAWLGQYAQKLAAHAEAWGIPAPWLRAYL